MDLSHIFAEYRNPSHRTNMYLLFLNSGFYAFISAYTGRILTTLRHFSVFVWSLAGIAA